MMGSGAKHGFGGFGVIGGDCVDNVRDVITRAEGMQVGSIADTDRTAEDVACLVDRLEKVHSLSDRFSGVELSPYVEEMLERADVHRIAV